MCPSRMFLGFRLKSRNPLVYELKSLIGVSKDKAYCKSQESAHEVGKC